MSSRNQQVAGLSTVLKISETPNFEINLLNRRANPRKAKLRLRHMRDSNRYTENRDQVAEFSASSSLHIKVSDTPSDTAARHRQHFGAVQALSRLRERKQAKEEQRRKEAGRFAT